MIAKSLFVSPVAILIESQWNLNVVTFFSELPDKIIILIESQWNLNEIKPDHGNSNGTY